MLLLTVQLKKYDLEMENWEDALRNYFVENENTNE
jgi:hypothetical protein